MDRALEELLLGHGEFYVQQRKEWGEILIGFEAVNRYVLMDAHKAELAWIAEKDTGWGRRLARWFLGSHRPFDIELFSKIGEPMLRLSRSFFWFFSDLDVRTAEGEKLGSVHRRFGILHKKYDLRDEHGQLFATIRSPIWRLWTFPVLSTHGQPSGAISKRWGGALKEIFTDADTYRVEFGPGDCQAAQRAVILAAAISVDFDFFENNQGRQGVFSFGDLFD